MALPVSTTTLLGAVNRVLELIGERRVTSLTSPIATLTKNIITDQVNEMATVHDWSWTRDRITATSWVLQTATLSNVSKIWSVVGGDATYGFRDAAFLEKNVFNTTSMTSYDYVTYPYGAPRWWTIKNYLEVDVNPYPSDSSSQARVFFDVTRLIIPPTLSTQTFSIPEQFISLIIYRAAAVLAIAHLNDEATAAQMMNIYEMYAQRARQTDGLHPARGLTMNRRGRGLTY